MCATILLRTGHRDHKNYPELARLMIIKLIAAAGGYYPHYVTLRSRVTCHVSRGPAAGRRCAETRHYQGTSRPHAPHNPCTALLLVHEHQESSVEHFLARQKPTLHQATTCIPSMSTSLHTKPVQSEHVSPVPDKYDNWILHKSDGGSKYIRWPEVVLAE